MRGRSVVCGSRSMLAQTNDSPRQNARLCRNGEARQDCAQSSCCACRNMRGPGRLVGRPAPRLGVHSPQRRPQLQTLHRERYILSPSFTRPETPAVVAARRPRGRRRGARRNAGGRGATASARARRRLVILEVRRILELILGPTHFEFYHGGIVIARRSATAARAATRVVGNGLE